MKKERIKSLLGYGVLILIGVGCFYLLCLRAEQIDKEVKCDKVSKGILKVMYSN